MGRMGKILCGFAKVHWRIAAAAKLPAQGVVRYTNAEMRATDGTRLATHVAPVRASKKASMQTPVFFKISSRFLCGVALYVSFAFVSAPQLHAQGKPRTGADAKNPNTKSTQPTKSKPDSAKSEQGAIDLHVDAANFQNNGRFQLAIEEWQKLIKQYPKDPLVSRANHFLGVCYMQNEKPDYEAASQAFARALTDAKLDVRDESLINLGWCQFMQARNAEGDAAQRKLYEQARQTLTDYVKTYPQGNSVDQALFFSGEIEYSLGNPKKAAQFYEQLIKSKSLSDSSWKADAQYALGVAQEQLKQDAEARQTYSAFLKDNPDHRLRGKVALRLADVMLRDGAASEAETLLKETAADESNQFADYAMLRLGQAMAEQKKYVEATDIFEKLVAKFPQSEHRITAQLSAGQMYFRNGQYPEAAQQFKKVLVDKGVQGAEAAHLLAMTLQRTPQAAEAIPMLQDAMKWAKDLPMALTLEMDLADALYSQPEKVDDARKLYEKVATEHPDDGLAPRAAYNAAFAALQLGKLDDARKWSETFLKKYPQDPLRSDVAYVASETMLQQGQHQAAIEAYTKLIESDKANTAQPVWNMRLAMAYYLSGKHQQAYDLLKGKLASFQAANEKAEAQFIMGSCLLFLDKSADAIEMLKTSLKTSKEWVRADEVMLLLAQAYQRQNDADGAIKTLTDVAQEFPKSRLKNQARYRIAQIRAARQDYDGAIKDYKAILADPAAASMHDFSQYGIVLSLMKQDKYADALEQLKPLKPTERSDSLGNETMLAQSICLRKIGKVDESIDMLDKLLAKNLNGVAMANALYELGLAQVEKKNFEKAAAALQKVLKEVPDYPPKTRSSLNWAGHTATCRRLKSHRQPSSNWSTSFPTAR